MPSSMPKGGSFSSGSPAACAADQIGTMLSPCSPRIVAVTCVGGSFNSAAIRPRNRAELAAVQGVGEAKLDRYGAAFLAAVARAQEAG